MKEIPLSQEVGNHILTEAVANNGMLMPDSKWRIQLVRHDGKFYVRIPALGNKIYRIKCAQAPSREMTQSKFDELRKVKK